MRTTVIAMGAMLGSLGLAVADARSQVLEIGDDGSVTTYSGPMVFTSHGSQPLMPQGTPAVASSPAAIAELIAEA